MVTREFTSRDFVDGVESVEENAITRSFATLTAQENDFIGFA